MPTALIADPEAKRRRRSKIYGFRTFMDPGCPADFAGAFRDNIRRFVEECADAEEKETAGMPTWCTLLVDEKSGVVVPLYTVEEAIRCSPRPLCDYCRCNGEVTSLSPSSFASIAFGCWWVRVWGRAVTRSESGGRSLSSRVLIWAENWGNFGFGLIFKLSNIP